MKHRGGARGQRRLSAVAAHVIGAEVSDEVPAVVDTAARRDGVLPSAIKRATAAVYKSGPEEVPESLEVSFGSGPSRPLEPLSRPGRLAFPAMRESVPQSQHLEQRREAETGSSKLWRIHGKLYDLEPFLDRHPGGRTWLELTRGTDATTAFEAYHLDGAKVEAVLAGYYVRDVKEGEFVHGDRYTYEETGFWRTLRRRVLEVLRKEAAPGREGSAAKPRPATGPTAAMKAACAVVLAQCAAAHAVARSTGSVLMAGLTGALLTGVWGVGHNFMHQAESRAPLLAHAMDVTGFNADDWKISHGLSHHLDTNLPTDWEGTFLVPSLSDRTPLGKFVPLGMVLMGPLQLLNSLSVLRSKAKAAYDSGSVEELRRALPGLPPLLMLASYVRGRRSFRKGLALFCVQMTAFALAFSPLGAGVHHAATSSDNSNDSGDASPSERRGTLAWLEGQAGAQDDFGAHQVISTTDHSVMPDSIPPFLRHWLSLSLFGYLNNHTLHHLFPGVDASRLEPLQGVFEQTLKEFGLAEEGRAESPADVARGFWRYLLQRRVCSRL